MRLGLGQGLGLELRLGLGQGLGLELRLGLGQGLGLELRLGCRVRAEARDTPVGHHGTGAQFVRRKKGGLMHER